jgi:hypothetical protein
VSSASTFLQGRRTVLIGLSECTDCASELKNVASTRAFHSESWHTGAQYRAQQTGWLWTKAPPSTESNGKDALQPGPGVYTHALFTGAVESSCKSNTSEQRTLTGNATQKCNKVKYTTSS